MPSDVYASSTCNSSFAAQSDNILYQGMEVEKDGTNPLIQGRGTMLQMFY